MKKYPAYKDSGVEWIGEIPNSWIVNRIKPLLIDCQNGVWGDEPKEDQNDIICVRVADFNMNALGVSSDNLTIRNIQESQQNSRILKKSDLLIEKSGGGEKQPVGRVIAFDLDRTSVCSNFVAKISPNESKIISRYLLYYFQSLYSWGINIPSIKQTTGIQNLDTNQYFANSISLPSIAEQLKIAAFLDHKTRQIDDLIAKKQRLIELLREERTALINQAVTKGLDPTVPMKDSGIEWLGEIPEHWKAKRLKFLAISVQTGNTPPSEKAEYYEYQDVDWFTPSDFGEAIYLNDSHRKINSKAIRDGVAKLFKPYSVLIIGIGATLGKIGIIDRQASSNQQINSIEFSEEMNPIFAAYFLKSHEAVIKNLSNAATLAILNQTATKSIYLTCPPKAEQEKISKFVDEKYLQVESSIKGILYEVELISEYKSSLINEAVTGKIDVRDYPLNHARSLCP